MKYYRVDVVRAESHIELIGDEDFFAWLDYEGGEEGALGSFEYYAEAEKAVGRAAGFQELSLNTLTPSEVHEICKRVNNPAVEAVIKKVFLTEEEKKEIEKKWRRPCSKCGNAVTGTGEVPQPSYLPGWEMFGKGYHCEKCKRQG